MREWQGYWLVKLLKVAKKENSPGAFRELLEGWLIRLGVEAPEGIVVGSKGPRVAPRKATTQEIYRLWHKMANSNRAHWHTTSTAPTTLTAMLRNAKRLRDRCRRAAERCAG